MAETYPAEVATFKVIGRLGRGVADSVDEGAEPDLIPIEGAEITFTPTMTDPSFTVPGAATPIIVFQESVKATTDENGFLKLPDADADEFGVILAYGHDPDINPTGWNWQVTISVGGTFKDKNFIIAGLSGGVIDLANAVRVPAKPGTEMPAWILLQNQMAIVRTEVLNAAGEVARIEERILDWDITSTEYIREQVAAAGPVRSELLATMGSSFSRRNVVRPAGYGPQFQDAGVTLYTHEQTGLPSLYVPQLYPIGALDPDWEGPYWISPNSPDHDEASPGVPGLGGVCIMVRDDEDPLGPFTSHRVAGNPVIYRDTTLGAQTEWPRFVYMPDDPDGKPHYLYYQQEGVGRGQSTLLAKTDNPLDPSRYTRVGIVMQGAPTLSNGSAGPGDGQTTYADPFPWGESVGFVTIDGGGSLAGAKVLWRSDDGIRCTRNPRRIADRTDLTGDTTLRFVYGTPFQWRGEWWATFMRVGWGSGLWTSADGRPYVAKVSSDLRSIVSKPYPMLPGNVLPPGVASVGLGIPVGFRDKILVVYRAGDRFGTVRAYYAEA